MTEFSQAYLKQALWSSTDGYVCRSFDVSLESMGNDLAPETRERMEADCVKFEAENSADLRAITPEWRAFGSELRRGWWPWRSARSQWGRAFWLTRNGIPASDAWEDDTPVWWCMSYEWPGNRLTEACKAYGEYTLYIGDDGLIYGA